MRRNQTGISKQYKVIQERRTVNLAAQSHTPDCYKTKIDITENSTKQDIVLSGFSFMLIISTVM